MPFETDPAGDANPCSGDNLIAQKGRMFVIDLVAHHHPPQPGLVRRRRDRLPVGDGDVLHPAQIGDVVDVTHLIDIGGFHRDSDFEGR